GLPHEFRQSQELADIAGFYRAFGFTFDGKIHERPDFLASELEFMHILTLKEARAVEAGRADQAEICIEAERKFLQDHLGRWIGLFAQRFTPTAVGDGPYLGLVQLATAFIDSHADQIGARPERPRLTEVWPTPLGPDYSCDDCAAVGLAETAEAEE
ncbi:MAG TPA: molecular chaperone TorD family protein, partial [Anaerolineae bacterium]|nr:molecular chaperone TorD family protein [Anaerolineae bacterium]